MLPVVGIKIFPTSTFPAEMLPETETDCSVNEFVQALVLPDSNVSTLLALPGPRFGSA